MILVLLGPPGAGKGTQAKTLAERLRLPHVSTGDMLRHNVAEGTDLGKEAKSYMERGVLVPDALLTQMLARRVALADAKGGFILDGYPRTIGQAEILEVILKQNKAAITVVIYLDASEPVIIQRLSGRLVCSSCGLNFHATNMPPKKSMVCDTCGSALYQRPDDRTDTVRKRLEVYLKETSGLINYYEKKGQLERVSADGPSEAVLDKVVALAKERNGSLKV